MEFINNWYRTVKAVMFHPKEFFKSMPTEGGFGEPFRFAMFNVVVATILSIVMFFATSEKMQLLQLEQALVSLGLDMNAFVALWLLSMIVMGAVGLFVSSAIYHVILKLVGAKKNYQATFRVGAYMTALSLIVWIPIVNILIGIYALYVLIVAYREVHEITTTRAIIAVVLIFVLIMVILIIISVISATLAYMWFMNMQNNVLAEVDQSMQNIQTNAACIYATFHTEDARFNVAGDGKLTFDLVSTGTRGVNIKQIRVTAPDMNSIVYTSPDDFNGKVNAGNEVGISLIIDTDKIQSISRIRLIPEGCPQNTDEIKSDEITTGN